MAPRAIKALGQHFLSDPNILRRIVDALEPSAEDVVLEIGPGKGSLTEHLCSRGLRVIAIEKDRRLADELGRRNAERGTDRLTVVLGDALEVDWHALAVPSSAFRVPRFKVVGNIPYNITSPLIDKALTPPLPERVVFLVQAEVADRLAAQPGSKQYGALTVGVQALCQVERLFTVKAGAFTPRPKVDSAVVRLKPRQPPLVEGDRVVALRRFVTACFTRRRKQLGTGLRAITGRTAAEVAALLAPLGLDPELRPERLTPQQFVRLELAVSQLGGYLRGSGRL